MVQWSIRLRRVKWVHFKVWADLSGFQKPDRSCARVGHLWLGLAAVVVGLLGLVRPLLAQSANQAGLVVVHGNGQIVSRCVAFTEPQISGYDLLQRSGLDLNIEVNGIGAAICRIDGEGCTYPQQSCFCGTEGDSYIYWSYWQWLNDSWQYANQGASNHLVQPGAVQGWVWGAGTNNSANPPPAIAFAEVCVAPTAAPTVTPTATTTVTPTVMPTASATPLPTASPTTPPTLAPTVVPTAIPSPSLTWTPVPLPTPTGTATWTATPPPPQITLFAVNPPTVTLGQAATLLWQVQNASQVLLRSAEGETLIGSVGNLVVQPQQSSTYTLVARNASGEVTGAVSLEVAPPPAALPTTPPVPTVAPTATAPLPLPTEQVTPTAILPLLPTATMTTPIPPSMAQPVQSTISATGAPSPVVDARVIDAAAVTPIVLAVAPGTSSAPLLDPATTRLQVVTLLGGVVLVLIVPLSILGLVALLWLVRKNR